jgi:hypothetical protein
VLGAILAGALLSFTIEGAERIAWASAFAFTISELVDLHIYEPLRRKNWLAAVGTSNTVGLIADSVLFLWLAFGSLIFLPGQILGKAYMTIIAVLVLGAIRAVLSRNTSASLARFGWGAPLRLPSQVGVLQDIAASNDPLVIGLGRLYGDSDARQVDDNADSVHRGRYPLP